jgi:hypothetical protein
VTCEHFILRLEKTGTEYTLLRFYTATYVEIGRFGYRFNNQGKLSGGWIHNCGEDWEAEWQKWFALLKEPI